MKKKRNLYIIAFLCFITLVGVTIAYLGSTSVLENIFEAGTYKTVTHEEFVSPTNWVPGDTTPKTITTKNEGTIPVMVRVKFEEEWTSKNDADLPIAFACNSYDCYWDEQLQMSVEKVAIINLDNESDWIYKDGYYYYLSELAPEETTSSLIKSVTFNPNYQGDVSCTTVDGTVTCESTGDGYDGATYKLKITTETVQAKNYETIWENAPIMYDYVGDNPCTFEGELVPGAEFVSGQYTYRFRQSYSGVADLHDGGFDIWNSLSDNGWGVKLTDWNSTDPVTTSLCSSINNKPIVSMSHMFDNSKSTSLDLSSFDTSNVTNMGRMFYYCEATSLDFSSFNTSNVIDMSWMFAESQATTLGLSSFDTSKVTDMTNMFSNSQATSLDLSSFDTSNVTNMSGMFINAQTTTLNLSGFDTSKVINMGAMFSGSQATSIDLSNFDTSNVTTMISMFAFSQTPRLDLSSFDTSKVTDMSWMFENSQVATLDLSSFDTSNVTNMSWMFNSCEVTTLNLSSFDTSSVIDMYGMFARSQATTIDLSSFDTSNVTNMNWMFAYSRATTLDLSSFVTSDSTNMSEMFYNSSATTGYARTQADADRFNASSDKPSTLTFVVKGN